MKSAFSEETVEKLAFLPITATLIFTASFSIGFGPLPWVVNSELFPREAKALASSIGKTKECCDLIRIWIPFYSSWNV